MTFQEIIFNLQSYWANLGCVILQPLDLEIGAGTFHQATFLRALGSEPWRAAFVQPCRRPTDGRYGENPNRAQHYYQFQTILKPSPSDAIELYINSLKHLNINPNTEDLRFVEDNWESPTLGAWGIGWEVWLNGMEITQFTYFQQIGGINCNPITVEITYGLERLALYLQNIDNIYDILWSNNGSLAITYGDIFRQNEVEMSNYNFNLANIENLFAQFRAMENECEKLVREGFTLPAYEAALKASHLFNLLDARGAISVSERQNYILRVRTLTKLVAQAYCDSRKNLASIHQAAAM